MTRVRNLATLEEKTYSCPPRQAVLAAYAQQQGDWKTWDYEATYAPLLHESCLCFVCGDWAAFKDGREG